MTLEDFFTLTEMRDGLTAPTRVQELIYAMQKEKDSVSKSSSDAIRQWAAVASSIAATESRECIDLFLQLDGLSFINRWLLDADKFGDDTKDGFVEESINVLLNAVVKLQLDSERSISSGICLTIENLLCHRSSKVWDKARELFDSWKPDEMGNSINDGNTQPCNNTNGRNLVDSDEHLHCVNTSVTPTNERDNAGNSAMDPMTDKTQRPTDSTHLHPEKVEDESVPANNDQHPSQEKLNPVDVINASPDPLLSSPLSNSGYKKRQDEDGHPTVHAEVTTVAKLPDDLDMQQNGEGQVGVLEANRSDEAETRANEVENVQVSLRPAESTALKASESRYGEIHEETISPTTTFRISGVSTEIDDDAGARPKSESNGEKDERVTFKEAGDISCGSNSAQNTHGRELNQRKIDDSRIFFSKIKYGGMSDEVKDPSRKRNKRTDTSVSYRLGMETSRFSAVNRNQSNVEIDYGIVDALEVARQVAQEVEREVVDYKERFCSSPSGRDSSGLGQAGSPESIQGRDSSSDSLSNKLSMQNSSSEASSEDDVTVLEDRNAKPENLLHDLDFSRVTEASQEPEDKTKKCLYTFDLNIEVCPGDDLENVMPSASKTVAASPRRKFGDSTDGRMLSSLNIDLNVAESGDDKIADFTPSVQIPVSSSLPSEEFFVEVSSRRHGKLTLDLNRLGDDGEPSISDFRSGHLFLPESSVFVKPNQGPVISILGTKVQVSKKDHFSQTLSLLNDKSVETAVDAMRLTSALGMSPGIPFQHPPHIWVTPGATISPDVYRPGYTPYIMNPRVGPISSVTSSYAGPAPFMMSMSNGSFALNDPYLSHLRPPLDLNSGFSVTDGVNRESGTALRQFLVPDHGRLTEDLIMGSFASSSSGGPEIGIKRKEPDGGWERYPNSFQLQQPPWK